MWAQARGALLATAWEALCRDSVAAAQPTGSALSQCGPWLPAGRFWHGHGPEWDIVSQSTDGKRLLLAETKWSSKPVSNRDLKRAAGELRRKGVPPIKNAASSDIVHGLFVPRLAGKTQAVDGVLVLDARHVVQAQGFAQTPGQP